MSSFTRINSLTHSPRQMTAEDKLGVIESLTADEALLVEFPDPSSPTTEYRVPEINANIPAGPQMPAMFEGVTGSNSTLPITSTASSSHSPVLQKLPMTVAEVASPISIVPMKEPIDKHIRLPANEPIETDIKPITTGRNMLACFGNQRIPRTRYRLMIEAHDEHGHTATATIDARLSLSEICSSYPAFVTGSLLRIFSVEGYTPQLIWNLLPQESRISSNGDKPWAWLDDAMDHELTQMALAYTEEYEAETESVDPSTPGTATPVVQRRGPRPPNWSAAEDSTLLRMKAEGKTHQEVANVLGRPLRGCISRLHLLKVKREKADAEAAIHQAADDTMAVDRSPVATSPVEGADSPMVVTRSPDRTIDATGAKI